MVGVEHLTGVGGVELLLGALRPRHRDQPVEVAADHRGLRRLLALALEPAQLLLGLIGDRLRHPRLGDLALVLLDQVVLVLAQLLADRLHLLAQEVLALLLLGAGLDVVADLAAHLQLGQPLALQLDRDLQPLADVEGVEQAQLLLGAEFRAEAGRVGKRARLLDRAQEGGDATVVAAQLEDLLDHGAVLARQLDRVLVVRVSVVELLHVDAQRVVVLVGDGGAAEAAVQAEHGRDRGAAARVAALEHLGDDADAGELAVAAGEQEDAILLADVDRQRGGDGGEDDCLVEWDEEIGHDQIHFL